MGQTTLAFWQLILLAVGPAFLTACVALGSPLLLEGRKQRAENRKKRIEKLEELIGCIYDHRHWLDQKRAVDVFGANIDLGPTPISKIEAITHIYFPEFKKLLSIMSVRSSQFELWMIEAGQKRLKGEANYIENFKDKNTPFLEASHQLMSAITLVSSEMFDSGTTDGLPVRLASFKNQVVGKVKSWFSKE